jgi:hypothetical protein
MIVQDMEPKYNVKQTAQEIYLLTQTHIEEVVAQPLGTHVYK